MYTDLEALRKAFESVTGDCTCPMHIAAEIEQILDCAPTADVVPVYPRKHRFNLTLGDFSLDGHERHENFLVEADKPVEAARAAHACIQQVTGIDISKIASENDLIPSNIATKLTALGYQPGVPLYQDEYGIHLMDADMMEDLPDVLADIWVFLLNKADPDLHAVLAENDVCSLLASGMGFKNVGYGLYKD